MQLGDSFQGGEGLIDGDSHAGCAISQLLFNIVGLAITWVGEEVVKTERRGGDRYERMITFN